MTTCRVAVDGFEELAELEGSWNSDDDIAVLTAIDVDGAPQIAQVNFVK